MQDFKPKTPKISMEKSPNNKNEQKFSDNSDAKISKNPKYQVIFNEQTENYNILEQPLKNLVFSLPILQYLKTFRQYMRKFS